MKNKIITFVIALLILPTSALAISVSWEKLLPGGIHPFGLDKVLVGGTSTTTNNTLEVQGTGYFSGLNTMINGFLSTASSSVLGVFNLPLLSNGCLQVSSGAVNSTGSSCGGSGSSFAWPFDVHTGYVSTSTTLGFFNGLFSTASSTFSGPFRLSALGNGYLKTTAGTGLVAVQTTPIPLADGGTATSTFYNGGVVFSDGTKLTQAALPASFYWNNTTNSLGIGTTTPVTPLEVVGNLTASNYVAYRLARNMPGTINNYVELGSFVASSNGNINLLVSVSFNSGNGASVAKVYAVSTYYMEGSASWIIVKPIANANQYSSASQDFDLDAMINNSTISLRLRKTKSSITGNTDIQIMDLVPNGTFGPNVFTPSSGTGAASPVPTSYLAGGLAPLATLDNLQEGSYNFNSWNSTGVPINAFFGTNLNNGGNTPTSTFPTLVMTRDGVGGQSYGNIAEFKLGRYAQVGNEAKTQMDIALTNGSGDPTGTTVMSMQSGGNIGVGTTSPGSLFSVGNTNGINFRTATSTFASTGGINLASGCYAIGGTCVGGGGSSAPQRSFEYSASDDYMAKTYSMTAGQGVMAWAACGKNVGSFGLQVNYKTSNDAGTTTLSSMTNAGDTENISSYGLFTATTTYSVTISTSITGTGGNPCDNGMQLMTQMQ